MENERKTAGGDCSTCDYYTYDEDEEAYFCDLDLDEDEMYHYLTGHYSSCPYYLNGDEYRVVRHQM